jgi:hypothetical protein
MFKSVNRHYKGEPLMFLIITFQKDIEKFSKTGNIKSLEKTFTG